MELRFKVDDNFMKDLKNNLNEQNTCKVFEDAFTLLNWITSENKQNRVIASVDENGENIKVLNYGII